MSWLGALFGKKPAAKETTGMNRMTMQEQGKEVMKMTKDPVCGMDVNEKTAAAKAEYLGKTYYFYSPGCKKTFDADPAKYAGSESHAMGSHGGHKM